MVVPWIPYAAKDFLDSILVPGMRVFEWGSGGSTLYFAERVAGVVSVEHDPKSHLDTSELLIENGLTNCRLLRVEPRDGMICADKSNPLCYYSDVYPDKNFRKYASTIDGYNPFDLVFVDGRARPSCLHHAWSKVESGGWLVLDNSDREYYLRHFPFEGWEERHFFGHGPYNDYPWQATFWRKPDATS